MRVLILHDETASFSRADQQDALVQAEAVANALQTLGHQPAKAECSLDLPANRKAIEGHAPDIVFNLVESVGGSGRLIYLAPALLDTMNIPYVGADTEAMFLTSNKVLAKKLLRSNGLPTPDWVERKNAAPGDEWTGGRWIIKSTWEEASVGLDEDSVVAPNDRFSLEKEIDERLDQIGGDGFAERYIEGREFNLSLLGDRGQVEVLSPAEIHFVDYAADKPKVVGYRAKWDEKSFEYHHTPRCFDFSPEDGPLLEKLKALAISCWRLFKLRGWVRVDFRVDSSGQPWILEINANPCLSPDAGFAAALARTGIPFDQAISRILTDIPAFSREQLVQKH
ncbi:MAG: ATP-grasp domain-containing protein [Planctomycetota bacterium]